MRFPGFYRTGVSGLLVLTSIVCTHSLASEEAVAPLDNDLEPLPKVMVKGNIRATLSHRFGDALDSGTSELEQEAIATRSSAAGDANQALKALPTVQFSSRSGRGGSYDIQDLRPENLSISGGIHTENLFLLDGIGTNSRLDVSSTNPNHFIEGNAAASAQTHWVDSSLVDSITVRDSNVSAQYGQFTGGVVEVKTRSPGQTFGITSHYGETGSGLTEFPVSDQGKKLWGNTALPDEPDYSKKRYGLTMDLPLNDRVRMLAAYSRNEVTTQQSRTAAYAAYPDYGQTAVHQSLLVKSEIDLADGILMTGQLSWTPYETEFGSGNGIDNRLTLTGGGLAAKFGLSGSTGPASWQLDLSHAYSETDRDVDSPGMFTVNTANSGIDWCFGSSCTRGGTDPLEQRQWETALKGSWEQPLGRGEARLGFDIAHVEGEKSRPETVYAFRHGQTPAQEVGPGTVCADPNEGLSCVDGQYGLAQRNSALAFDSEADLQSYGLWGEYRFDLATFLVRSGLRYDHETLLENHNFAPRLSISHGLPWGIDATLGLNRYYTRDFLGYALRENYPPLSYIHRRDPTLVDGKQIWSDNWYLYSHLDTTRYSDADLDTPYSDEVAFALQGEVAGVGGEYRIKAIVREYRDQISSSEAVSEQYDRESGGTATRRVHTPTNDGKGRYKGLSVEYLRKFDNHALSFSANISRTRWNHTDYFAIADDVELAGDRVWYRNGVVSKLQAMSDNQRDDYAAPLILNADWTSNWWQGRIRANINVRYRDGVERVQDTTDDITIDGTRYDIYDKVRYGSFTEVNLSLAADLVQGRFGAATLDVRLENALDEVPESEYPTTTTSSPYQLGRSLWLGIKYRY